MTKMLNSTAAPTCRRAAAVGALAAALGFFLAGGAAKAQSLTVLPVTIQMEPGQMAATLTVINLGDAETAVQIRAFTWNQVDGGDDRLATSDEVRTSPPVATIPPGTTQIVRLVLRRPPQKQEATYRIVLDQIPPAAEPGTVRIALRLSIPIFAAPKARAVPNVRYHVENDAGQAYLVALNDGGRHETLRNVTLTTSEGAVLKTSQGSPYVLAGATRRWRIAAPAGLPAPGGTLRLTALADSGAIDQPVPMGVRP
jgi:fimbrial chaperone protein